MRCAVLGDPIAHSLSPVLHRAGYTVLGLDWAYDAVRVPAGGLPDFFATLDDGWRGLSLTMPLKREVLALGDEMSDRTRASGVANTVVLEGGRRVLWNTDIPGAVAAVRERTDAVPGTVVILGAGATAASVGLALCDLGARDVRLLARSADRAAATASVIAAHEAAPKVAIGDLDNAVEHADVVVSTIPSVAQIPNLVQRWQSVPVVFEVLYEPWPTPLAAATTGSGQVLVGGLDLLVHQAALQLELFTGHPAPLAEMRIAGELALAERSAG